MDLSLTPFELEALVLSLRVALWSTVCSLPFGVAVAWLLARRRFPGHALLNALVHVPLVVPPVVVGYLLLVVLGRRGAVGGWLYDTFDITVAFTWQGAAIASAVIAFPLMVRAIRLSLETIDRRLELAARTLGASAWGAFWSVTMPMALPGLLAGATVAFARSLGEFGATITFVSNIPGETQTLPLALFQLTQQPGHDDEATRLVVISLVIAFAALLASEALAARARRRIGQAGS